MDVYVRIFMYKNSFSPVLKTEMKMAFFTQFIFFRFENVIKHFISIFGNQLWTVALLNIQCF